MRKVTSLILLSILTQFRDVTPRTLAPPVLKLKHGGSLQGTYFFSAQGKPIDAFLGVPYADPPVGLRRFADPFPDWYWHGTLNATTPRSVCLQFNPASPLAPPFGSEDCLYLNVYTPRNRHKTVKLPVMVFIHGGAYFMGSSTPQMFGPQRLLDYDVVLVTFNYRLGPLGFLSTENKDAPGNFGLKDQVLVLQWVREFIRNFGGDPENVTLFGQSSGSASVSLHMVSYKSGGLFHKAILQSGNYKDPWATIPSGVARIRAHHLGYSVGCPMKEADKLISCLREADARKIVMKQLNLFVLPTYDPATLFGPVVEPPSAHAFLDRPPSTYNNPYGDRIPIIIGATADEGLGRSAPIIYQFTQLFVKNFERILPIMLGYDHESQVAKASMTHRVQYHYFQDGLVWSRENHQNLTNMFSDRGFYFGMERFLDERLAPDKEGVGDTYVYIYDHNAPKSATSDYGGGPERYYGVCHEDELPMLFPYGQLGHKSRKRDQQMQWILPRMWTDFAKTGDPTPSSSRITEKWKRAKKYPYRYARIGSKHDGNKGLCDLNGKSRFPDLSVAVLEEDDDSESESSEARDLQKEDCRRQCEVYTKKGKCSVIHNYSDRFWSGFII